MSDSLWAHGLTIEPMGFSRPEYGSGLPFPSPGGIFPTQGKNPGLMHFRRILYQLSHKGSLRILDWVAYPFCRGSSWPRSWTGVSCITGRFFTNWAIRELIKVHIISFYWISVSIYIFFHFHLRNSDGIFSSKVSVF